MGGETNTALFSGCLHALSSVSDDTHSSRNRKYSFLVSKASTSWRML